MPLQTTTRPAFGRRIAPQPAPAPAAKAAEPVAALPVTPPPEPVNISADVSVDLELQAWKETRGSQFKIPWRQIYLMASLCFGIASFVLPDSVNDNVDYLPWI